MSNGRLSLESKEQSGAHGSFSGSSGYLIPTRPSTLPTAKASPFGKHATDRVCHFSGESSLCSWSQLDPYKTTMLADLPDVHWVVQVEYFEMSVGRPNNLIVIRPDPMLITNMHLPSSCLRDPSHRPCHRARPVRQDLVFASPSTESESHYKTQTGFLQAAHFEHFVPSCRHQHSPVHVEILTALDGGVVHRHLLRLSRSDVVHPDGVVASGRENLGPIL